jgi:preprotein translocase subunit SecF
MENIKKEIELIKKRNRSVEIDKAWETSVTRRIFVASITYLVALLWMRTIGESLIFFKACIPTGGYLLSTLSLPFIKKWWSNYIK